MFNCSANDSCDNPFSFREAFSFFIHSLAFAVAAAIAVAAWHCCPPLGMLLAALAVLIALSRVLSGVHYISDVVAGLAFGCGCALVGWQVYTLAAQALAR